MRYSQRLVGLAVFCLSLVCAAQTTAAEFRDYASVLRVEPIATGEYRTQMRQVCAPQTGSELAIAASIGEDVRQQADRWRRGAECRTQPQRHYRQRITGYWVTYSYGGVTAKRRMSRDPGKRLPVDVRLSPRP